MNDAFPFPDWASLLRQRAQQLHQQIATMQRLVLESGGGEDILAKA